ncbi:MAG: caspase family protein [Planctomycetota bacterium]
MPRHTAAVSRTVSWVTLVASLCLYFGCTHPNIQVSPNYDPPEGTWTPAPGLEADESPQVAINVTDQRRFKGTFREDGSEVIASGDKGKVILQTPMAKFFKEHLTEAYEAAGFEVRDNAAVQLNVVLRELRFEALAFTHWGLPTDRASTLDMAGVFLPGPPRDTRALTVVDIDLSKDGQDVGLSYYIEGYAWDKNTGKDPAVVAEVISDSWSDAINRTVASTAPGIPVVASRPMTDDEQRELEGALTAQRAEVELVLAQLEDREKQLESDRIELMSIRKELDADRKALANKSELNTSQTAQLATEIALLQNQLGAARAEAEAAKQAADTAAQAGAGGDAELDAQLAAFNARVKQLETQQAGLTQQKEELIAYAATLEEQRDSLTSQSANLQSQLAEVDQQRKLFAERSRELVAQEQAVETRQGELQDWNLALAEWKTRLAQAETEIQQRENAFREREAQVAKTEEELQAKADELEKLEIERMAITEKVAPPAIVDERNARPIIYVSRPEALSPTTKEQVLVTGHVFDDVEVVRTAFTLNGKPINPEEHKGIVMATVAVANTPNNPPADTSRGVAGGGFRSGSSDSKGFVEFAFVVPLQPGHNRIRVEAWDDRGESDYAEFDVERKTDRGLLHMVSIGINEYDTAENGVPKLRYAVADAKAVSDAMARNLGITGRHIELYDEDATRSSIIQALRKTLPGNVSKQDTVIVFFSGHGAPETLAGGLGDGDADNLVRYLLPVEAEADNLIGSAIPMQDIARYFRLLPCERLIFMADTCYSGGIAEGGRTVSTEGVALKGVGMSTIQIVNNASGRGRVILTASKDNEIAHEKAELGHGVFTYHLVEGLDGAADSDNNRQVTVRELYDYVAAEVPRSTDGSQHPQINDEELRGDIVLSKLP